MSNTFQKLPLGTQRWQGYISDPASAGPGYLSYPSSNCLIDETGKAANRLGYTAEFSIGSDGNSATPWFIKTYDVAFFAIATKMYYYDYVTKLTHDTGVTLTAGTTTRFDEDLGIIFSTNTTDGMRMFVCGRLNDATAVLGDANVVVDADLAGRLSAFSLTTASLIVEGNAEPYNAVNSNGTLTLVGTLSHSYSDNRFCLVAKDISGVSGIEKFSKIAIWKTRLHGMGFPSATNADQPNNSVMTGQFIMGGQTAAGDATDIQNIIDFTYGTGGSTKIMVSGGGALTNILGVGNSFYFLNEHKTHSVLSSDITTSGTGIGGVIPNDKDNLHGCLNEDCAAVMGDEAYTYVGSDKRIIRQRIDPLTGTPLDKPEEDFDIPIRKHLVNMDKDQTGALIYHYRGGRQTIYQLRIAGQWTWFIWDYNITNSYGGQTQHGGWQPPQSIIPVRGLFERDGVLWGTDATTDTVYSFFTAFSDNFSPIQVTMATGELNVGQAMLALAKLGGDINQPSQINIRCYVWNQMSGKRSGSAKVINGASYIYDINSGVSALPVGTAGGVGVLTPTVKWNKEFGVFPSEAQTAQIVLENFQDGGYFSWEHYQLTGTQFPTSFNTAL